MTPLPLVGQKADYDFQYTFFCRRTFFNTPIRLRSQRLRFQFFDLQVEFKYFTMLQSIADLSRMKHHAERAHKAHSHLKKAMTPSGLMHSEKSWTRRWRKPLKNRCIWPFKKIKTFHKRRQIFLKQLPYQK